MCCDAALFDFAVDRALFRDGAFERDFERADFGFARVQRHFERHEAQRVQFGGDFALFFLQLPITLGGARLALQMVELPREFFAHVVQAVEVLFGMADAVFGFAAAFLVLRNAGRFFEVHAQIFGLRLDELADHALLDDRVAARPEAGAEEDVHDVATPALRAVQEIRRLRIARDLAADRDFGVLRVFAADAAVGVVERQFDAGERRGLAGGRAVEDDVGKRFAAQLAGGAFAHHPTHRVDDVRLTTPVGSDDGAAISGETDRCRIYERLEAGQLDLLESHRLLRVFPKAAARTAALKLLMTAHG